MDVIKYCMQKFSHLLDCLGPTRQTRTEGKHSRPPMEASLRCAVTTFGVKLVVEQPNTVTGATERKEERRSTLIPQKLTEETRIAKASVASQSSTVESPRCHVLTLPLVTRKETSGLDSQSEHDPSDDAEIL